MYLSEQPQAPTTHAKTSTADIPIHLSQSLFEADSHQTLLYEKPSDLGWSPLSI